MPLIKLRCCVHCQRMIFHDRCVRVCMFCASCNIGRVWTVLIIDNDMDGFVLCACSALAFACAVIEQLVAMSFVE